MPGVPRKEAVGEGLAEKAWQRVGEMSWRKGWLIGLATGLETVKTPHIQVCVCVCVCLFCFSGSFFTIKRAFFSGLIGNATFRGLPLMKLMPPGQARSHANSEGSKSDSGGSKKKSGSKRVLTQEIPFCKTRGSKEKVKLFESILSHT